MSGTKKSTQKRHTFLVNEDKGKVSALLQKTNKAPIAQVVLAHGAGANMQHTHMQSLADMLGAIGVNTLRFQFPYMEAGGRRVDSLAVCMDTILGAVGLSESMGGQLPTFLAGHSFGARMSSHFAADYLSDELVIAQSTVLDRSLVKGLIYFSFPLHPSKKPDTKRAAHLEKITMPQLFLSGTRDLLAELSLLEPTVSKLQDATLHTLDTADHGYKILKRTRVSQESVYDEAGRIAKHFFESTLEGRASR